MTEREQVVTSARPGQFAHFLIARVAREQCAELYETVMGINGVRAEWKRQNPGANEAQLLRRFVARNWAQCIPAARATLTLTLRGPLPEHLKEQVLDALIKDRSLRALEPSKAPAVEILNREALR